LPSQPLNSNINITEQPNIQPIINKVPIQNQCINQTLNFPTNQYTLPASKPNFNENVIKPQVSILNGGFSNNSNQIVNTNQPNNPSLSFNFSISSQPQ
jgi:hypothetical protein